VASRNLLKAAHLLGELGARPFRVPTTMYGHPSEAS